MARLDGISILIVDDDHDIRAGMSLALRAEGANILEASDGNEAVAQWRIHMPDVVVLDMMLPKRSGFLVLEELIEGEQKPVIVMVTANQGRRHEEYARRLGVDGYLTKPIALEVLIATIHDRLH
ncbi:MAG: response regulator [Phycisphaerales bacterium]|nr:response regulator [Phycisphaerales bacterium]